MQNDNIKHIISSDQTQKKSLINKFANNRILLISVFFLVIAILPLGGIYAYLAFTKNLESNNVDRTATENSDDKKYYGFPNAFAEETEKSCTLEFVLSAEPRYSSFYYLMKDKNVFDLLRANGSVNSYTIFVIPNDKLNFLSNDELRTIKKSPENNIAFDYWSKNSLNIDGSNNNYPQVGDIKHVIPLTTLANNKSYFVKKESDDVYKFNDIYVSVGEEKFCIDGSIIEIDKVLL